MPLGQTDSSTLTIPFEKFWAWLQAHSNCIVRAGTPEVLLFDHEDYHWHLAVEDEQVLLVQVIRGKNLVSEMVVLTSEISYVQCEAGDHEEFVFECIVESETARDSAYHFVLSHGFDETPPTSGPSRWTH